MGSSFFGQTSVCSVDLFSGSFFGFLFRVPFSGSFFGFLFRELSFYEVYLFSGAWPFGQISACSVDLFSGAVLLRSLSFFGSRPSTKSIFFRTYLIIAEYKLVALSGCWWRAPRPVIQL